jgi:hypothetical protein
MPLGPDWKPGGEVETTALLVLSAVWVAAATATGFLLALLARKIHPGLSLVKLWLFYTVLMATLVAIVFVVAWL